MQSFAINAAKAINRAWGRGGKVFAFRYGANPIKTRRYARNAISYVLNNWRRHREDFFDGAARAAKLDEYSSAISFDGWERTYKRPVDYDPLPVSAPRPTCSGGAGASTGSSIRKSGRAPSGRQGRRCVPRAATIPYTSTIPEPSTTEAAVGAAPAALEQASRPPRPTTAAVPSRLVATYFLAARR